MMVVVLNFGFTLNSLVPNSGCLKNDFKLSQLLTANSIIEVCLTWYRFWLVLECEWLSFREQYLAELAGESLAGFC